MGKSGRWGITRGTTGAGGGGTDRTDRSLRSYPSYPMSFRRHHADALALRLELHHALDQREQRVVLAPADVPPRGIPRATLPHDDAARLHAAAAVNLDAQPLAVRLAA